MPTIEEYLQALENLKSSPNDKIGVLGELGVTGIGIGTGVAASGTIASAAGASTLLGSSTLGSLLGGMFVTTTPFGWVVGSAVAAGALAYGATKLVRSGGKADGKKELAISNLKTKISKKQNEAKKSNLNQDKKDRLIEALQYAVYCKKITPEKSDEIMKNVSNGRISFDFAFQTIQKMV